MVELRILVIFFGAGESNVDTTFAVKEASSFAAFLLLSSYNILLIENVSRQKRAMLLQHTRRHREPSSLVFAFIFFAPSYYY